MSAAAVPTLDAEFYTSGVVLAAEREHIFAENWLLFGPAHELASPGSYRADVLAGHWPILVVRDEIGVLRAFHNVCRHRAAMLFAYGASGICKALRCPYHGWVYSLDGSLLSASDFGDESLDKSRYGLFPVRVEVWQGLVFVCLSERAPPLLEWLGSIPVLSQDYPAATELDYHGQFVVEGEANWKTYCDNTVEGYHLPLIHPRLTEVVARECIDICSYDDGRLVVFHVEYRGDGTSLRGAKGIWYYRFPGFAAVLGQSSFKADRIDPLGTSRQRSTSWGWYKDLTAKDRDEAFAWAKTIVEEDLSVCEQVQRNLEIGIYTRGVLSPKHERHTARFQHMIRQAVGKP